MKTKSIQTLLVKQYELKSKGRLDFKRVTPLLQMQHSRLRYSGAQFLTHVNKPKAYKFQNMVSLFCNNKSNARRQKTISRVREQVLEVIDLETVKGKYFDIYLNQIALLLPSSYVKKHLEIGLKDSGAKDLQPTKSPLDIIRHYQKFPRSWQQMVSSSKKAITILSYQNSNHSVVFNNIYILEAYPEQRANIFRDFALLKLSIDKFNFFEYLVNLQSNHISIGYKTCQRFIKAIKFSSPITEKYLLLVVRYRSLENLLYTIKHMMQVYDTLYSHNK